MGGEMVYILDQRLSAQEIVDQKAAKVINDIVGAMFNSKFVDELFRPQELYPKKSVKQIFEKLAHSSIMRLNEASMDKLYDLMTMSVKFQIMLCPCAADIIKVTYNHVNSMRKLVRSSTVLDLLDKAFIAFNKQFERLNDVEWLLIRDTILFFFQDVHIRVSIFLRENLQTQQGQFIMKTNGIVPTGFQTPGEIRTYKRGRLNNTHIFNAGERHEPPDDKRTFHLGLNIYSRSKNSSESLLSDSAVRRPSVMVNAASDIEMINPDPKMIAQLNLLSDLIGNSSNSDSSRSGLVKLSLFDDDDDEDTGPPVQKHAQASSTINKRPKNDDITIDVSKRNQNPRLSHVLQDLDFDERPKRRGKKDDDDDDDDLCALMDRLPSDTGNKRR
ncbi:unnamed protein product [Rotaria socialis]|uniref:Protein OSCP1 n=1 Tax=Rotaria socialis TaxID=392032 RepID=A0A818WWS8_9BILA|nr:unnamed protein product [Rotaria socialis]CAF3607851.1 unnamed protein product [Rotaria socialis]CAF3635758.1 unnamed protein product [Rotaria socialis]CAF3641664.1 unnamed protein product [Rotaria socialis]CAF3732144.1 unnamed protein product [Rotaria socialis]